MASLPSPILTAEQYVEIDNCADSLYEYIDGEMFEVEAATPNHGRIQGNLTIAVGTRLRTPPCAVLGQSARVQAPGGRHFHPDLLVVCGKLEVLPDDSVLNPAVVFEILSKSTAGFDLGRKGVFYRSIPSLQEYILVEQSRAWVQRWTRQPAPWHVDEYAGLDAVLPITALGCEIPLSELYRGADWNSIE